ncbi:hypothetical protein GCM10028778_15400 [Barrientosiimonas marina]|uniref:CBO0543 family protein n=1 Tax=Lentibacillus kimchii TaxID=1542911 RepID=A0ABW2UQJ4_9BACI
MDMILLWVFFIAGVGILIILLQRPPLKEWLLCFFIAACLASFLGQLVVSSNLISYPVKLFPIFKSSILYEYLLLPLLSVIYYRTTYRKDIYSSLCQAFIYSSVLTVLEVLLEQGTDFIHYISWNWMFSLVSLFSFLLIIRYIMQLINKVTQRKERNQAHSDDA